MIEARPTIVFDLDGTLADTAPDIVATLNVVLSSLGHAPLADERATQLIGAGARALLAEGLTAVGESFDSARLDHLFIQFLTHYESNIANKTQLYPGALNALEHLAREGFPVAVCTNKMEAHSKLLLEKLGVANHFGAICGRDSFPYFKPDARHLTMTIAKSGGEATHAIMVGDSRTDIDTARNAGLPVIGVTFGYSDTPIHSLNPDLLIEHYDHLYEAVVTLSKDPAYFPKKR
jgi:phosphoglycolate phosphatase